MQHVPFDIKRSLLCVPMVALDGDNVILDYNGKHVAQATYLQGKTPWISPSERLKMRRKVVLAECLVSKTAQPFVLLHYAAPQFEMDYLESTQFLTKDNQLKADLYLHHMMQDITLILTSFADYLDRKQKLGILRVPAVGLGYFATLPTGVNIRKQLEPQLCRAWQKVLTEMTCSGQVPLLLGVDFVGWCKGPVIPGKAKTSSGDVLDFTSPLALQKDVIYGIVNGGDCFSMPGNEFSGRSLDSYIGQKTDMRFVLSPWINKNLLFPSNWKCVKV